MTDVPVVLAGSGLSRVLMERGGSRRVLFDGLDIEIESGSSTAIVGPSGCGKSSLLEVLGLLRRPDAGVLEMAGKAVSHDEEGELTRLRAQHIGFVFQSPLLVESQSARQNVVSGLRYAEYAPPTAWDDIAQETLSEVGLAALADKPVVALSGGERQRVSIARAVAKRPLLLICDEPTASLDRSSAGAVLAVLDDLRDRQRTAIVLATHDHDLAARCRTHIDFDGPLAAAGERREPATRD